MLDTGLQEATLQEIRALAEQFELERVVLFGSRARGDYHTKSDIDLALTGGNTAEFSTLVDETTSTLLSFDFVRLDETQNEELISLVAQEGVCLYEKTR